MCGIIGALSLTKPFINVDYAKPMADKISHRGPDDAGYLFFHTGTRHMKKISFFQNVTDDRFKNIEDMLPIIESNSVQRELKTHDYDLYLGHRRLSILDTTYAGHQPMSNLSKNIWLAYNGEIYNFKEIRTELEKFNNSINNTINESINNIDISNVSRKIEQLLDDKIKTLELENIRLQNLNNNLEKKIKANEKKVNTIISQTDTQVNESIKQFNKMSKVVNWGILASVGGGGLVIGIISTFFILSSHLTR